MSIEIAALITAIGMNSSTRHLQGFLSDASNDVSWVGASGHLSGSVLGRVGRRVAWRRHRRRHDG
jgi:hypothetical protein